MNTPNHTPEPWIAGPVKWNGCWRKHEAIIFFNRPGGRERYCLGTVLLADSYHHSMEPQLEPYQNITELPYAENLQRMVSCVNACTGMSDPAEEIAILRQRISTLEQENARLKDACDKFSNAETVANNWELKAKTLEQVVGVYESALTRIRASGDPSIAGDAISMVATFLKSEPTPFEGTLAKLKQLEQERDGLRAERDNWEASAKNLIQVSNDQSSTLTTMRQIIQVILRREESKLSSDPNSANLDDIKLLRSVLGGVDVKPDFSCFRCNDGNTPLYCLNCAESVLNHPVAAMRQALEKVKQHGGMKHREDRWEVCYSWCPLCAVEKALSLPTCGDSDKERMDWLEQFFSVEDVGDDYFCPGVVVDTDRIQEALSFGPAKDGKSPAIQKLGNTLRQCIDAAIDSAKKGEA